MFGRRNNKLETLSRPSRYASTPLEAPGNLYTSRRREEVDADGDLDDLIQQEIQRYEELFQTNNDMSPGFGDDDTLQDGSIYTSMQASAMLPTIVTNKVASRDDEEDATMWGLENQPAPRPQKPVSTSLLSTAESAAAKACHVTKAKSCKNLFVPPVAAIPVDDVESKGKTAHTESEKSGSVPTKKSKSKFFPKAKRLLKKSSAPKNPVASTPQTEASTPATTAASKIKLFSPVRFLRPSKSFKLKKEKASQPGHANLLLASMAAGRQKPAETQQAPPVPDQVQVPLALQRMAHAPPPSPPPPIETCEFRFGDGASVGSAQSSLTDALDAWMVKNSPPKIIGGNHLQERISPFQMQMEAYEGGLTPYYDPSKGVNNNDDEEASAGCPGGMLMTADGLYFRNQNGQAVSPVRPHRVVEEEGEKENAEGNLSQRVWAETDEGEEENSPEDSSMERVKIIGLQSRSPDRGDPPNNVKRNLFGASEDDKLNVSKSKQDVSQEQEEEDESVSEPEDDQVGNQQAVDISADNSQKASKFKKFLNKLVSTPKSKQAPQEAQKLNAEEKAKEVDKEEIKQKLECGESESPVSNTESTGSATPDSHSVEDCPARSFSLMSGDMKSLKEHGSQSSTTAEVTSNPTTEQSLAPSSTRSMFETPRPGYSPDMLIQATPSSSYLVNFQFLRLEGDKKYTMAYSVDSSLHEDIKWKDIVNQAWKEDRRVVKSGVFSAIQADIIAQIQRGELEMRFELPFWGKHASQTMGPKTLDLLLDVVGPQRPVQVTISLEEPQVAAGVDDDGAPDCLF